MNEFDKVLSKTLQNISLKKYIVSFIHSKKKVRENVALGRFSY